MSNIAQEAKNEVGSFFSGGPGTTGREVFEDGTKTVHAGGAGASQTAEPNIVPGQTGSGEHYSTSGAHEHHGHHHHHGHGHHGTAPGAAGVGAAGTTGSSDLTGSTGATAGSGPTGSTGTSEVTSGTSGFGLTGHGPNRSAGTTGATDAAAAQVPGQMGSTLESTGQAHHHHHKHHSHEHDGHIAHGTGNSNTHTGAAAAGAAGVGAAAGYEAHKHEGHHHGHHAGTGATRESGTGMSAPGDHTDRVGALGQNQALYERTTDQGPVTSGAAGTDRFDTDKPSGGLSGSSATGAGATTGTGVSSATGTGTTGAATGTGAAGAAVDDTPKDTSKGSGGLMGILGTSDHDFTRNTSRMGGTSGAYADTHGNFQGNTTGPAGNTALTGREGTLENNPVAKVKSSTDPTGLGGIGGNSGAGATSTATNTGGAADDMEGTGKKSFMQKVKDALT